MTNLGHSITGTDKEDRPCIYYESCWLLRGEKRDEGTLHMWGSWVYYSGLRWQREATSSCEIFGYISLSAMKWSCQHQLGHNPVWNLHSQSHRLCWLELLKYSKHNSQEATTRSSCKKIITIQLLSNFQESEFFFIDLYLFSTNPDKN